MNNTWPEVAGWCVRNQPKSNDEIVREFDLEELEEALIEESLQGCGVITCPGCGRYVDDIDVDPDDFCIDCQIKNEGD